MIALKSGVMIQIVEAKPTKMTYPHFPQQIS